MLLATITAGAQTKLNKLSAPGQRFKAASTAQAAQTKSNIELTNAAGAYYEYIQDGIASYYMVLSENEETTFDPQTGNINAVDERVLVLDLYATGSSPIVLPEGTYTAGGGSPMTYSTINSFGLYYNALGQQESGGEISGNITVKANEDNTYTINATTADGYTYNFTGRIVFVNVSGSSIYPQINDDIETTFTGGLGIYHGNIFDNNTGNIYINLYDTDFDPETGATNGKGHNFAICAISRYFADPKRATITPGVYEVAQTLKSGTMYPGMELDAMGTTIVFGSYVKRRKALNGDDNDYDFAYIASGTMTITEGSEAGTFNIVVDCQTENGFLIKGEGQNISFPIIDMSDDKPKVVNSNLTEDVNLDQDYIKTARIYTTGVENNCRKFLVDIGSPSGLDGDEGDILRMEFLADHSASELPTGTYEVMEKDHLWTNLYAPFKLVQGYFYNGGEMTGTRYQHFEEGRYCVVDLYAEIISGRVSVEKVEGTDNYKFSIDLADGNGYKVQGEWTGPMEIKYDPTGVDEVETGNAKLMWRYLDANHLELKGISETANVSIYTVDGRFVQRAQGSKIDVTGLNQGIYLLKAEGQNPVKFIRK